MADRDALPCRTRDPEIWFPIGTGAAAERQTEIAKLLCSGCPIKLACLKYAMETGQQFGIWGGASEDDRTRMRQEQIRRSKSRTIKLRGQDEDHRTRTDLVRELASR